MSAMHWPWPDAFWNRKIVKTGAVHIITRKIPVCGAKRNVKPVNTAIVSYKPEFRAACWVEYLLWEAGRRKPKGRIVQ